MSDITVDVASNQITVIDSGSASIEVASAQEKIIEVVVAGPAGPQGDRGEQGLQGPQGLTGPQGPQGVAGPQGPEGPQGAKGDTGDVGPQGIQGPQGPQGLKGDTGNTGPQGIQGVQGVQGVPGDDGRGILTVARTSGTGSPGTADTYTITYTDATTSAFNVYNGADGVGSGDMLASLYDTDSDGKVNSAAAADSVPWSGVSGKPTTFTPSAHGHVIADVTGLQTALDGKQPSGSYAAASHAHTIANITDWPSAVSAIEVGYLDGVTSGIQSQINGKQPSGSYATISGVETLDNKSLTSPTSTGAIYDNGSVRSNIVAVPALDIDCSAGNYFTKTINGASTFTVSNVPASRAYAFTLELTHTSGTVTWFANLQWAGGTAPTLTTGKTHLFTFVTDDGGARWRGVANINYTN